MSVTIEPLDDHVIYTPIEEERTAGGIILPNQSREKARLGRVVAVGPGPLLRDGTHAAMNLAPGDVIILSGYQDPHVDLGDGAKYRSTRRPDVVGVVKNYGQTETIKGRGRSKG